MLRLTFIGLGQRGVATLERYVRMDQVCVVALCDVDHRRIEAAQRVLREAGMSPAREFMRWDDAFSNSEADAAFVCTDWATHADIACSAMNAGLDVAVEVPAAVTIAECYRLVEVSRVTGRKMLMLENCCFDPFTLRTFEMARCGVFGDMSHYEGAYIHDLRGLLDENNWYGHVYRSLSGNPYPTHGLGPGCKLMGVTGTDEGERLVQLVSMSAGSDATAINNTLIQTSSGRTLLLQHDIVTPRPYSRLQTVCGTHGYASKYPVPTVMPLGHDAPLKGEALDEFMRGYMHPIERAYGREARALGVKNLMNYYMDRRVMHCLLTGDEFDISVEEAALWCAVGPLSAQSVSHGNSPVPIPIFTRK